MSNLIEHLTSRFSGDGTVTWIGLRPQKKAPLLAVDHAEITETGLVGDHRSTPGKRAVTLIQAEHLPVIATLAGLSEVLPETLRRNIVIKGINLTALKHKTFLVGSAELKITGPCAPCSRMEKALGIGGYNAMRGHGGMTAEVITPGMVLIGDSVCPVA